MEKFRNTAKEVALVNKLLAGMPAEEVSIVAPIMQKLNLQETISFPQLYATSSTESLAPSAICDAPPPTQITSTHDPGQNLLAIDDVKDTMDEDHTCTNRSWSIC